MQISPVTLRVAKAFISRHHRHNKPPVGHIDDGLTLEVNRTCTTGERNANSKLYGAVWRAAKAMGYRRCITYTRADESGASLRAVGFVRVKELPSRKSWAESSVAMKSKRDPVGNGGVPRVLWEIRRMSTAGIRIKGE
ncbi:XF1762 family protein [Escherichia coli]|uniref:XF1762 family protein n=1 Tax=Escherichia coli TaxID=562 RepID=UPI0017A24849|nr:hypothetical protein [Escherichia coli]EGT1034722.1 hypothetical protein [Escherichia coli]EHO4880898.1 hypothetical protein [Escherichia coli]MBB9354345.1 hypothetical protein [Escherichia coli]